MGWISKLRNRDEGAQLIEFAILAPFLILLVLGIVEFGWGLAQQIDVRHRARETVRAAIVDEPVDEIRARACENDIVKASNVKVIHIETGTDEGSELSVEITASMQTLTGLLGVFFGSDPEISSTAVGRVEQDSSFSSGDFAPCP